MDLGTLISQAANRIRKNWILLIPPILTQAIVPVVLFAVAVFTIFPLVGAFSLTGDVWGLVQTIVVGGLLLAIVGFLVDTFVTAGWAYMNKRALVDGETRLEDLWAGARRYFLRVLGGRLLVGVIVAVPIAAWVAALAVSLAALNITPGISPSGLAPETILGLIVPQLLGLLGMLIIVGLIELALYVLLLPWMQALVMDDLGIWASIKASYRFVRKNLATMVGYVVISAVAFIVASWATSFLSPGFPYLQLAQPTVYTSGTSLLVQVLGGGIVGSVITALLSAFFTLLLFAIYADRTGHSLPVSTSTQGMTTTPSVPLPEAAPSRPRVAPRGMKYCVNCGATIISLAVFCPNCGARQPPLAPQ